MNFGLMRELQIGHKHAGVVISYVFFLSLSFAHDDFANGLVCEGRMRNVYFLPRIGIY
jgi:hypothetical protein